MIIKHSVLSRVFALGMSLSVAVAPAHDLPGNPSDDAPVPASAQDWFRQGQKQVQANKFVNSLPNLRQGEERDPLRWRRHGHIHRHGGPNSGRPEKGGQGEENSLSFERFPYSALSKTYSVNQQTPDSAPTMTAMVTGIKTNDGELSVNQYTVRQETSAAVIAANSMKTILERAKDGACPTGVVTSTRVTHATPAATYAHTRTAIGSATAISRPESASRISPPNWLSSTLATVSTWCSVAAAPSSTRTPVTIPNIPPRRDAERTDGI